MKRLKVLVVCCGLGIGGAEVQLSKLLPNINKDLFDVRVAHYLPSEEFPKKDLERGGVSVRFLGSRKWNKSKYFYDAMKYFANERFDIIHCWLHAANLYGGVPAILTKTPVVIGGLQGLVELNHPWNKIYSFLGRGFSAWVVNSNHLKNELQSKVRTYGKKIHIVKNGIDLTDKRKLKKNTHYKNREKRFIVGSVGRLVPVKNHLLFVEMAKKVLDANCDAEFWIVGDGPMKERIKDNIARLSLGDRLIMLGKQSDMEPIYEQMHLLVLTSNSESCPNVLLEAMSYGLPVISTNCTDLEDIIEVGKNGFVVELDDVNGLAENVFNLIESGEGVKGMGQHSQKIIEKNFNLQQAVSSLESVYTKCFNEYMNNTRRNNS